LEPRLLELNRKEESCRVTRSLLVNAQDIGAAGSDNPGPEVPAWVRVVKAKIKRRGIAEKKMWRPAETFKLWPDRIFSLLQQFRLCKLSAQ
jgi:hypothetical protein